MLDNVGTLNPDICSSNNKMSECPDSNGASVQVVGDLRVLLMDDDDAHLHLCRDYLWSDTARNHEVVPAKNITEAQLAMRLGTFDCVLVGFCVLDRNAMNVIDRLRAGNESDILCVIVMTGGVNREVAIKTVSSGVNELIYKSDINRTSLCRTVNNAVEKYRLRQLHKNQVKELQLTNSLLRKRNEEVQRFYHTVSHEVRTPLTAIQEFVSIMQDGLAGEVNEEQKIILRYALQSCDQIKSQFNELLELSRFETGAMQVNLTAGSIYEVLDHCVVAATPSAVASNIELSIDDQADLPLVLMQSNRITQVLSNLIGNALKYTPNNGKVTVGARVVDEGNRLQVSVTDTGCGIPAKDIKKVFDRLFKIAPADDFVNETGMGLGLYIASQIVGLHGSEIKVSSRVGNGSVFWFELDTCEMASR